MRYWGIFCFIGLFFLFPAKIFSGPVLTLEEGKGRYFLGPALEILEDQEAELTLSDVQSPSFSSKFKKNPHKVPGFGFTDSAYWVRFTVESKRKKTEKWFLELAHPLMDSFELYIPSRDGSYIPKKTGYLLPFEEREIPNRYFVFQLDISPGEILTYYCRFKNGDRMEIPLRLWSPRDFSKRDHSRQYILGVFYGLMFVMMLYNFILFFYVGDRSYLYYVIYLIIFNVYLLTQNGLAYEYFWPDSLREYNHYMPLVILATLFSIVQFTQSYLNTKANAGRLNRVLDFLKLVLFLLVFLPFFTSYQAALQVDIFMVLVTIIAVFATAIWELMRKYRPAIFFLLAWTCGLLGGVIYTLKAYSIVPSNLFTAYGIQVGAAIEVVLISLGLGDRITILKRDKEIADEKAIKSLKETAQLREEFVSKLEQKVAERTEELTKTNRELHYAQKVAERDMRMAVNVQENFLPQSVPVSAQWEIAYIFRPMSEVSGDFYDFYMRDNTLTGVGIFDVSGHGIASGLVTMIAKSIIFRFLNEGYGRNLSDVLAEANEELQIEIENIEQYVTGIILRFSNDCIEYVNAAHQDPYVKSKDRVYSPLGENGESIAGVVLGLSGFELPYDTISFEVEKGDYIVLNTDCLSEAMTNNEEYGTKRIKESLRKAPSGSAEEVLTHMLEDFYAFVDDKEHLPDDLTVIVLKRL